MSYQTRSAPRRFSAPRRPAASRSNGDSVVTIRCGPPRSQNNGSWRRNNRNGSRNGPHRGHRHNPNRVSGYVSKAMRDRRVTELRNQIDNDGFQTVGRHRNPQQVLRKERVTIKPTNRFGGLDSDSDSEEEDTIFRPTVVKQTAAPAGAWGKKLTIEASTEKQRWTAPVASAPAPAKVEKRVTFAEKEEVREIPSRAAITKAEKTAPIKTAEEIRKSIAIVQKLHDECGDSWADAADKDDYAAEIADLEEQLAELESDDEPEIDSFGRPTSDNSAW